MKKLIYTTLLGLILCFNIITTVSAEKVEATIDLDDDSTYYLQSNGKNGYNNSKSGETSNNSNQESTRNYTTAESNAMSTKSSIRGMLNNWINQIKNTESYADTFFTNSNQDALNLAFSTVSISDITKLLESVKIFKEQTASNETAWINHNVLPSEMTIDEKSDIGNMTEQEKSDIKNHIVNDRYSNAGFQNNEKKIVTENQVIYNISDSLNGLTLSRQDISGNIYNPHGNFPYFNIGSLVRRDVYSGFPSMRDTSNYADRFNGLLAQANDNGWNDSASVYLDDAVTVSLLTDYHLYSVKKDYITNTSYISNERRWNIQLDGKSLGDPVITDDPEHELNFTEIYKKYGAGKYHIVAEQLANVQRATFVAYDICEYLFETETGNILYYNESLVRGSGGGSIFLNAITSQEWVETNDTFDITINDLGEVEKDGASTQREE